MNYFEKHIGDYLKDTAHLSLLEHGVYNRLFDVYYTRESGIPANDAARLIGARSRDEKAALASVLAEFFELRDGLHVQDRCDREIERFQGKQAKARASAEARWGTTRQQSEGNANAYANASAEHDASDMRTHSERNAPRARPQTPDTSNQTKKQERATSSAQSRDPDDDRPPEANGHDPTPAGAICLALKRRAKFAAVNPGDPRLAALISLGIPEETFVSVATEAVEKSKGWAWVLTVVERRHEEGLAIAAKPKAAAPPANAWTQKRSAVIDRACELGIGPWNESAAINRTGPSWEQYRARVIEADTHGVTS